MSEAIQLFDSEAGYRAAIDLTLAAAQREIRVFDRDLGRMALEEKARADLLAGFLAGGRSRRLRIVLHDTSRLEQRSPRLLVLMRQYLHAVEVRRTPDHLQSLTDCWVLADQTHAAIRFHLDHPRGKWIAGVAAEVRPWWQRFDDLWEECEPCSPGTTTGL